jgi:hypothetical protein
MDAIRAMRVETERWRAFHKERRNHIEAAACSIRLKALNDALRALEEDDGARP